MKHFRRRQLNIDSYFEVDLSPVWEIDSLTDLSGSSTLTARFRLYTNDFDDMPVDDLRLMLKRLVRWAHLDAPRYT